MSCEPSRAAADRSAESSALALTMRALRPLLANPEVTELCINRPQEAFVEMRSGWQRHALPYADFEWCSRFAKLVANSTQQRVDSTAPLLSASLPTGERVQVVLPPATSPGCVAIAIRRPADEVWSIDELGATRHFPAIRAAPPRCSTTPKRTAAVACRLAITPLHARWRSRPQEYPRLGPHRIGKDHLDQGAHSRNSEQRAADHHRGCPGTRARPASESCAPVLFKG
jgi:hypothetical protein